MIYAVGCSFTYGAELADRADAWPSVLQNLLAREVTNLGKEGCGNTRIVKRALDVVLDNCDRLVISWTNPSRIELADNYGIYDVWGGRYSPWVSNPDLQHRLDLIKYSTLHDQPEYCYANWLRQIVLVQSICKLKQIPCVMFISHNANKLHIEYHRRYEKLLKNIDMEMFVDKTMFDSTSEWLRHIPKMPYGHPDPEGHRIIANKVYEHIRYIGG
jgi:lysophospholipase L1-like esterase